MSHVVNCGENVQSALFLCFTALKIHLSSATKEVLDEFGYFDLQLRGDVEMKVRSVSLFFKEKHCGDRGEQSIPLQRNLNEQVTWLMVIFISLR